MITFASAPLVEGTALTKRFEVGRKLPFGKKRYLQAVSDITLSIYSGETLGLVGESGSGKSTLGRMLLGALRPTSGSIRFAGEDITNPAPSTWRLLRQRIQLVQQNPGTALDPHMTIGRQLAEAIIVRGNTPRSERFDLASTMLNRVGLSPDFMPRYPHELSGGQQQRIAVARALLMDPRFIVCDEPVSALDLSVQAQVLNLLKELQRALRLTYLFISHDLNVVRYMSHRIAVMYLGRIVEVGRSDSVLKHSVHPYTRALLASSPVPDPTASPVTPQITGEPPDPAFPPTGCRFHPRCQHATAICRTIEPDLVETPSPEHQVACHHPLVDLRSVGGRV